MVYISFLYIPKEYYTGTVPTLFHNCGILVFPKLICFCFYCKKYWYYPIYSIIFLVPEGVLTKYCGILSGIIHTGYFKLFHNRVTTTGVHHRLWILFSFSALPPHHYTTLCCTQSNIKHRRKQNKQNRNSKDCSVGPLQKGRKSETSATI